MKKTQNKAGMLVLNCTNPSCSFAGKEIHISTSKLADGNAVLPSYRGRQYRGFFGSVSCGSIFHTRKCWADFCD